MRPAGQRVRAIGYASAVLLAIFEFYALSQVVGSVASRLPDVGPQWFHWQEIAANVLGFGSLIVINVYVVNLIYAGYRAFVARLWAWWPALGRKAVERGFLPVLKGSFDLELLPQDDFKHVRRLRIKQNLFGLHVRITRPRNEPKNLDYRVMYADLRQDSIHYALILGLARHKLGREQEGTLIMRFQGHQLLNAKGVYALVDPSDDSSGKPLVNSGRAILKKRRSNR